MCFCCQSFIQALLLTCVFCQALNFMALGHNSTRVSTLVIATGRFMWGAVSLPCGVKGQCPWKLWLSQALIPGFLIAFPCIIWWPNLSIFRYIFACIRLAWWLHLPTINTKWQHKMAIHVNISRSFLKLHGHAFSCRPKRCWSQINKS